MGYLKVWNGMKAFARIVHKNVRSCRSLYTKPTFCFPPQMPVSEYTLTKNWPYAVELHNAATAWPKPYRKTDDSRQGVNVQAKWPVCDHGIWPPGQLRGGKKKVWFGRVQTHFLPFVRLCVTTARHPFLSLQLHRQFRKQPFNLLQTGGDVRAHH